MFDPQLPSKASIQQAATAQSSQTAAFHAIEKTNLTTPLKNRTIVVVCTTLNTSTREEDKSKLNKFPPGSGGMKRVILGIKKSWLQAKTIHVNLSF